MYFLCVCDMYIICWHTHAPTSVWKSEDNTECGSSPSTFLCETESLLFAVPHIGIMGPETSEDSIPSFAHLTRGAQGIEPCDTLAGFTWL